MIGEKPKRGKVYLVGAGPGDPGLITVKGLNCLRQADVVIYDRLVDETIVEEVPAQAERIYVGKEASHHTLEQELINALLLQKAREGKTVVRLKGGDPFILGRGGEEAEALAENGIPFEVVPGVSSVAAVPAYAGIPITHRGVSSSFTAVTGHKAVDARGPSIAWDKLANVPGTLIILMGMGNLENIVEELTRNGKPPGTPVAVITSGTTRRQRCVTGTLSDIASRVRGEGMKPPSIIVVGEVVLCRDKLNWFEKNL